ncbi:SusC/RagA family TonB-linked outer membrane protein [Pedobacter boryungensis]|uniref:SusC/RagA family TonB-linked outer membrane protein n=1 Tax=Pedobacter boryungensis TaxID=869962 RepID=A0ABX2DFP0_9SPHI|nr:SusC/RagA family TonB-linked outer membrane protein [Pedobacter boryungensis]NQX32870.1 SusC/RagA family TonB-linked outer membrane protein [Pedobacter boryungensis]
MKKLVLSLFILLTVTVSAFAQERTVSGTIRSSEDGLPIPGVSVRVKEISGSGVTTGADGKFTIKVAANGKTLVVSSIAFVTKEIAITSNVINVTLEGDSKALAEVIVTGIGGSREGKSIGYSATQIKAADLTVARNTDISTALTGKVSGVQLNGSPSSTFDNASIIVRGINGFSVGSPLFILDGTPTIQENVNMDNVESVTVLKGAAATAIYGQRAYNGVVVITSKKGVKGQKPSIEFSSTYSMDKTSILPDYQNEYGGGYTADWIKFVYNPAIHPASWAAFNGQNMLDYGADSSFGPKIDGTQYRSWSSWYPERANFGKTEAITAHPDNVKDFLQTGGNFINNLAFATAGENSAIRIGYTNQNRTLVQINSKQIKNTINAAGSIDFNDHFSASTDIQFMKEYRKGQPYETYRNDGLNIVQGFNQWFQRQLDMNELKEFQTTAAGTPTSWNIGNPNGTGNIASITHPQYWDNPFWVAKSNYQTYSRNRIVGNVSLKYKINSAFAINGAVRTDINNGQSDERMATGGLQLDYYKINQFINNEFNYEANATYKKVFGDFSVDALLGVNLRQNHNEGLNMSTEGGLTFPNYFNIAASLSRPTTTNTVYEKMVRSALGKVSLGYKGFLYVDVTGRNDWSSVFAPDLNSYFYPSVSGSFIASEFFPASWKNTFSFAKIRASYARVGNDLDPYQLDPAYNRNNPYGTNASLNIGDQLRDGRIRPALTGTFEVGTELKFFKDRLSFDFAYYKSTNEDQILNVTVNNATGYSTSLINAGKLTNRGFELSMNVTPIASKNVTWNLTANLGYTKTIVNKITDNQQNAIYQTSTFFGNTLNLREGKEWGYVLGRKFNRDANGNVIISASGFPTFTTNQEIGYARPKYSGGGYSSLRVFNFDLGLSFDWQKGGLFNSTTRAFNMGSGLSQETVGLNDKGIDWRLSPSVGGGYKFAGVLANGTPNTKYVEASDAFYTGMQNGAGEMFMINASYFKLREVRLGYSIPQSFLSKIKGVKGANVAFTVSNAWLISAPGKKYGVDPSEIENFWQEGGQLPASRSYGINLRLTF